MYYIQKLLRNYIALLYNIHKVKAGMILGFYIPSSFTQKYKEINNEKNEVNLKLTGECT